MKSMHYQLMKHQTKLIKLSHETTMIPNLNLMPSVNANSNALSNDHKQPSQITRFKFSQIMSHIYCDQTTVINHMTNIGTYTQ